MLTISGVSCAFGDVTALDNLNLRVEPDEIVCLLGPSGCGKTTLLRIVAGLITDFRGSVYIAGEDLRAVPVHERGFGLMFQDYALFPHLTVSDNIAYGLHRRRLSTSAIAERVGQMLLRVGLDGFGDRDVSTLSGGEQQRVALARSLAPNPRFLMLDEPLGSLDALLRDQLALELRSIIKSAGLSAIHVTHDHREAYAIADRIAVMDEGAIAQLAEPMRLYHHPANETVARFLGFSNIFRFDENEFTAELRGASERVPAADDRFLIHPEGVHLGKCPDRPAISTEGVVESVVFRGDHREIHLALPERMRLTCKSADANLAAGNRVSLHVALDAIRHFG